MKLRSICKIKFASSENNLFDIQSSILPSQHQHESGDDLASSNIHTDFMTITAHMILSSLTLFLNCWSDVGYKDDNKKSGSKICPELKSSFLNNMFIFWHFSLIWTGFRKCLTKDDIWNLQPNLSCKTVIPNFERHFQSSIAEGKGDRKISLLPILFKAFWPQFLLGCLFQMSSIVLTVLNPQVLKLMIFFAESYGSSNPAHQQAVWKGFLYAFLLILATTLKIIMETHSVKFMYNTGLKVKTSLISMVYKKSLCMSATSKRSSSVGEIVTLMSVDIQKLVHTFRFVNWAWSLPLQIILSIAFIYEELSHATWSGFSVLILMQIINGILVQHMKKHQLEEMKYKDQRVKLMNEVLGGMKIIKLLAWEPSYIEQIMKIRCTEMNFLKRSQYFAAFIALLSSCTPFLFLLASFGTFIFMKGGQELTPANALVTLSYLNVLRIATSYLPMIFVQLVQANISLQRLNTFINKEELDVNSVTHEENENCAISIEKGNFKWDKKESTVLSNIQMRVEKGSLTAIVGKVGTGKSSLLSAMLGELHKESGQVNTVGKIAYASQQAWIQNDTIRGNILFGKEYSEKEYNEVVDACALRSDFDLFPGGDQTEIGEKGINLSGGQKQRVSLARSIYSKADIFLLDDPLSAVDSHVGKHIFHHVIGPNGILTGTTRVLVTHGITYLPYVDNIIVMKDGRISEHGSYQELLYRKGEFAEFLLEYIKDGDYTVEQEIQIKTLLQESTQICTNVSKNSTVSKSLVVKEGLKKEINEKESSRVKLIEKERTETGSVKWDIYMHYFKALGLLGGIATVGIQMITVVAENMTNYWITWWTNNTFGNATEPANRDMYIGVYAAMGTISSFLALALAIVLAIVYLRASSSLHKQMLNSVIASPMHFFDRTPQGRIVNRFAKDIDICDNLLPKNFSQIIKISIMFLAYIIVIIEILGPFLLVIILPLFIIFILIQKLVVRATRQINRLESISKSQIFSHFGETISGAPIIRAFGLQKNFILQSENIVEDNQVYYFIMNISKLWLTMNLELLLNMITVGVALFVAFKRDAVIPSQVGLVINYANMVSVSLTYLVRMVSDVETNMVAVERIKEYSSLQKEAPWIVPERRPKQEWPTQGAVEFNNYSMRYREGLDLVVKDITCNIAGEEKVGIVGRTGAGKSSLAMALFRLIEKAGGFIKIDNEDISSIGLHDLRKSLTIIPQEPVLFSGSLRLNLDPFNVHTDEELWSALELAHLKSFASGLEGGLEHQMSEGGDNISMGQRQLVCLARALLRKTKVLILDEATAAVDLETDDLIQETIREQFQDCTVLTIAHRLNTIMDYDKIMVLDKGSLMEYDSPEALLSDTTTIFHGLAKDAGIVTDI